MREHKYQAWLKHRKEMFEVGAIQLREPRFVVKLDSLETWTFDEVELREFTGLQDKRGRDIYEGDIVATGHTKNHAKSIVRIGEAEIEIDIYDDTIYKPYYGVYLEGYSSLQGRLMQGEMYIIGNIYEHPELLK